MHVASIGQMNFARIMAIDLLSKVRPKAEHHWAAKNNQISRFCPNKTVKVETKLSNFMLTYYEKKPMFFSKKPIINYGYITRNYGYITVKLRVDQITGYFGKMVTGSLRLIMVGYDLITKKNIGFFHELWVFYHVVMGFQNLNTGDYGLRANYG